MSMVQKIGRFRVNSADSTQNRTGSGRVLPDSRVYTSFSEKIGWTVTESADFLIFQFSGRVTLSQAELTEFTPSWADSKQNWQKKRRSIPVVVLTNLDWVSADGYAVVGQANNRQKKRRRSAEENSRANNCWRSSNFNRLRRRKWVPFEFRSKYRKKWVCGGEGNEKGNKKKNYSRPSSFSYFFILL